MKQIAANALRALGAVQQNVPINGSQGVEMQYATFAGENDRFTLKKDDLACARSFLDIHSVLKSEPDQTMETEVLGALAALVLCALTHASDANFMGVFLQCTQAGHMVAKKDVDNAYNSIQARSCGT